MRFHIFLFAAATAAITSPTFSRVTVVGSNEARICYEAADSVSHMVDAFQYCNEALSEGALFEDDRVATLVNRGILYLRRGSFNAALADFDAAIESDPNQAEAYLNKGWAVLLRDGAWNEAAQHFTAALDKDTVRPEVAHFGRAIAHEMGGKVKAAYRDYQKANEIKPKWRRPIAELARFKVAAR